MLTLKTERGLMSYIGGTNRSKNEKNTIYINESGLYSLLLRSKLESARVFKRWVTKLYCHTLERKEGTFMMT